MNKENTNTPHHCNKCWGWHESENSIHGEPQFRCFDSSCPCHTHPTKTEEEFEETFPVLFVSKILEFAGESKFGDDASYLIKELRSHIHESNCRYARQVVERAMPEEKVFKEDYKCNGCGKCEACLLANDNVVHGFNSALTQFKENLERELK